MAYDVHTPLREGLVARYCCLVLLRHLGHGGLSLATVTLPNIGDDICAHG